MSRLRKAAKATVVTQLFHWSALLLSLATVPLYLAWLGEERYGLLLTGIAISSYLMFSDAGINWASMLLISQASGRGDHDMVAGIVRTSFPLAAISSTIVVCVIAGAYFALNADKPPRWLPSHPEFPGLVLAIGASLVVTLATAPVYNVFTGCQDSHISAIYQGVCRILGSLLAVGIASTSAPLGWVYCGNLAALVVTGIPASIHCRKRHPSAFQRGPFWDYGQVRQQLRTGAKTFVMQVGMVLSGTAPILAVSIGAGAQLVPLFSIPHTLITAPLSLLATFSTNLQPAFGEAISRGERKWIADTVGMLLKQTILALGLLVSGFVILAAPFITWWTAGKLHVSPTMILSVVAIAAASAILTTLRYAVTGINRHRIAAFADLASGMIALGLGIFVVRELGPAWIGLAVAGAALITTGWILPREIITALGGEKINVGIGFWIRVISSTSLALLAGKLFTTRFPSLDGPALVIPAAVIITTVFSLASTWLLPGEFRSVQRKFRSLFKFSNNRCS